MKKYIYIIAIIIPLIFVSCNDFLELESPNFSNKKFWRDSLDIEMGLSSAYGQLENRTNAYDLPEVKFVVETFREDIMTPGADVANYTAWVEIANFSYTNGNSQIKSYWMNNYNGINYTNNTLEGIRKVQASETPMSAKTYDTLFGEATFLRAYFHFKLLMNWEEIIVRDSYIEGANQTHKALSSRVDAWDFIVNELKTAASKLPAQREAAQVGRATSGMANSYLGWAYLTRAYEEPAKKDEYLNAAITAFNNVTGYALESDYLSLFDGSNKNSRESILELQFTPITDGGAYHKHVMHKWVASPIFGGWDEIRPSQFIFDTFTKEGKIASTGGYDQRAYDNMFFRDDYFNDGEGRVYGFDYDDILLEDNGDAPIWFRKFSPTDLRDQSQSTVSTNIAVMRYSNVLLMKAEAYNELNQTDKAIPIINEIRNVHGKMPAMTGSSKEAVKAQIEHERLMEFPLENVRFYDLRRWGSLEQAMHAAGKTNFKLAEHAFFPIPLMEIQNNNELK